MTLFDRIRAAAAEVASRARFVQIDDAGLASFAQTLPVGLAGLSSDDPAHLRFDDERDTLVYVLAVDAVNFGSGWFPVLRKLEGRSGYLTIATALRRHFEELGAPEPADLARITQADCARIFAQDPANPETWELMGHFARALRDLGRSVLDLALWNDWSRCGGWRADLISNPRPLLPCEVIRAGCLPTRPSTMPAVRPPVGDSAPDFLFAP